MRSVRIGKKCYGTTYQSCNCQRIERVRLTRDQVFEVSPQSLSLQRLQNKFTGSLAGKPVRYLLRFLPLIRSCFIGGRDKMRSWLDLRCRAEVSGNGMVLLVSFLIQLHSA